MRCCEDCYWWNEGKKNNCWFENDNCAEKCEDFEPMQSEEYEENEK